MTWLQSRNESGKPSSSSEEQSAIAEHMRFWLNKYMKFNSFFKNLRRRSVVFALIALAGTFNGPSALRSAQASIPPIEWSHLAFVFFGSLVAMVVVLGIQAATKSLSGLKIGWYFFFFAAAFQLGAGFSAMVFAMSVRFSDPSAYFMFCCGLGMATGLYIMRSSAPRKPSDISGSSSP